MMSIEFRSSCPISNTLDIIGDKWSLLIIRDLFIGRSTYSEMLQAPENIATNILVDRLKKLISYGLIGFHKKKNDGKTKYYFLTDAGIDLMPLLCDIMNWKRKHHPEWETHPIAQEMYHIIDAEGCEALFQKNIQLKRQEREHLLMS
ncbi:MAG: transcriptional regulator [Flavobacteriaceae bacterium]|nr:transcriptional regulator [Flavobacteriaceae bacterium]